MFRSDYSSFRYERKIDAELRDLISKLRVTDESDESLTELIKRLKSDDLNKDDQLGIIEGIIRCKNLRFVDNLIDDTEDVNSVNVKSEALRMALKDQNAACVKLLLEKGAPVYKNILLRLAWDGFDECLKLLIEAGADVNAVDVDKNTPLICAAYDTDDKCMDLLIHAGANVNHSNNFGMTPLSAVNKEIFVSCRKVLSKNYIKREECIKLLLQKGADVRRFGGDALFDAIQVGQSASLRMLIEAGADVNAVSKSGEAPLILALRTGVHFAACCFSTRMRFEHVALLLWAGAHLNKTDKYGHNALKYHIITRTCDKDLTMLLFSAGEIIDGTTIGSGTEEIPVPEHLLKLMKPQLDLKHTCRETIRKHLIKLDSHLNLFHRIPQLGLPSSINNYLLYDVSLNKK